MSHFRESVASVVVKEEKRRREAKKLFLSTDLHGLPQLYESYADRHYFEMAVLFCLSNCKFSNELIVFVLKWCIKNVNFISGSGR